MQVSAAPGTLWGPILLLLRLEVRREVGLGVPEVHEGDLVAISVALLCHQTVLVEACASAVGHALAHLALAHDHAACLEACRLAEESLHLAHGPVVPDLQVQEFGARLDRAHDLQRQGLAWGRAQLGKLQLRVREKRLLQPQTWTEHQEVAAGRTILLLLLDPLAAGIAYEELAGGCNLRPLLFLDLGDLLRLWAGLLQHTVRQACEFAGLDLVVPRLRHGVAGGQEGTLWWGRVQGCGKT
mmetsp:Transcript_45087/g.141335  ORF Transcript_45087/g.141335 Transcript_45087/m.141335 type:complete len:241 (-) Transcript_45087:7-729(-)